MAERKGMRKAESRVRLVKHMIKSVDQLVLFMKPKTAGSACWESTNGEN